MTTGIWRDGNQLELLENGEEYFPAVFAAIDAAQHEVFLETFILFEDKVGIALRDHLVAAARRGVRIECTVDGWGSPDLSPAFVESMTAVGIVFRYFDPVWKPFGWRINLFRRMHRKLVVVDARLAFVGGINFSHDHLAEFGSEAKQDYAVSVRGPVVADIHQFIQRTLVHPTRWRHLMPWRGLHLRLSRQQAIDPAGTGARVLFVTRDNDQHTTDIERQYRIAVRAARREVLIANAYFFPGYRLLRDIRAAARRGVRVALVLQGHPDLPMAMAWARMLYRQLVGAGVEIYEYCKRPFHGKVATVDGDWATVGSSNLDPMSLSLNYESNLVIRDETFAGELRQRLLGMIDEHCKQIAASDLPATSFFEPVRSWFIFHCVRRYPSWAGLVPAHAQRIAIVPPPEAGGVARPELVPVADIAPAAAAAPEPGEARQRQAGR